MRKILNIKVTPEEAFGLAWYDDAYEEAVKLNNLDQASKFVANKKRDISKLLLKYMTEEIYCDSAYRFWYPTAGNLFLGIEFTARDVEENTEKLCKSLHARNIPFTIKEIEEEKAAETALH